MQSAETDIISLSDSPKIRGPVIQLIFSLRKSIVKGALSLLIVVTVLAEKMREAFALQKLLTYFLQKWRCFCVQYSLRWNISLTNDVVSFGEVSLV